MWAFLHKVWDIRGTDRVGEGDVNAATAVETLQVVHEDDSRGRQREAASHIVALQWRTLWDFSEATGSLQIHYDHAPQLKPKPVFGLFVFILLSECTYYSDLWFQQIICGVEFLIT